MPSQVEIQDWLVNQIADLLYIQTGEIDISAPFTSYGLASRDAILLSGDLEEWLERRLSPTLVYEYPSIVSLASYLSDDGQSAIPTDTDTELATTTEYQEEPIPSDTSGETSSERISRLEEISDEEAEVLLIEKLNKIERDS